MSAGTSAKIPFFIPRGSAVCWRVLVKAFDVSFAVKLRVQELGGSVEQELEAAVRLVCGEVLTGGRKGTEFDRHILLEFDNSFSKLRSKTVVYLLLVGPRAVEALARDAQQRIDEAKAEEDRASTAEAVAAIGSAGNGDVKDRNDQDIEKERDEEVQDEEVQAAGSKEVHRGSGPDRSVEVDDLPVLIRIEGDSSDSQDREQGVKRSESESDDDGEIFEMLSHVLFPWVSLIVNRMHTCLFVYRQRGGRTGRG